MINTKRRHDRGLVIIAGFKLLKAVLLIAAGVGAFKLLNPTLAESLTTWLEHFSFTSGRHIAEKAMAFITPGNRGKITAFGIGAVTYGALFGVEGVGLWL